MIPVPKDQSKIEVLFEMFSNQPYVPRAYWNTNRGFELDSLLVPPPGSDPGSPDFQSDAMTTSAKEAYMVPGTGLEPVSLSV